MAGVFGGMLYGVIGASQPLGPGVGAISIALVMLWLCLVVALLGGLGVSFGIAAAGFGAVRHWSIVGGALGGMLVGAIVKLLGLDAFNLLLGRSPGDVTGGLEGALLGGAVGFVAGREWLRQQGSTLARSASLAALAGGATGVLIASLGGRMMGGSLERLAEVFPDSRLRLDALGQWFGEGGFGPVSRIVTGGLEGALFAACIVGAMGLARRSIAGRG
ncbi:MAG: hypothetical protein MUF07_08485 [Steroidobacteraceae bacterium]|nr:hypothetical protein [Steroidobacteraceae bacterium]